MSEGQGQFTIDAQPFSEGGIPLLPPGSAETGVFQGTPLYSSAPPQGMPLVHPNESSTPDAYMITAPLSQYTNNYVDESAPAGGSRRKPRVKSEKRSQSMTMWWAERKAKKREQDEKEGKPPKSTPSRSNSSSRPGARQSGGSAAGQTSQPQSQQASPMQHPQHAPPQHSPHHPPPEQYLQYTQGPPAPQHYMYVSAPPPPPHHMMMQYPLAALPSGSYPNPYGHPQYAQHQPGIPLSQPPPQFNNAGGGGGRQLAPAPMNLPHYPSPYGPASPAGGRPKSSDQRQGQGQGQVLAPAPLSQQGQQHYSPYSGLGVNGGGQREMPFKVMIPGPGPNQQQQQQAAQERRGSR
jgi:hypothetical protein